MATKAYSVRGVASIQREIMTRGPVSAALQVGARAGVPGAEIVCSFAQPPHEHLHPQVYSDFLVYQSGVYKHVSGSRKCLRRPHA
jgi:hypothetical protein